LAWNDIPDFSLEVAQEILQKVKDKDPFTFFHCCRVGRNSRKLAKALGLNEFEQAILEFSGLFHDIGKLKIPNEILCKPGRLDKQEIEVMKAHPQMSAEMIQHLDHVPFFRFLLPGIKYHHEKIDGGGYPNAMMGDAIPLFARLIAVVDSFDAMTNVRPYRNALPEEKAISEIKQFSGTQFDTHIAKAFLEFLPEIKKEEGKDEKEEIVISRLIKAA
jgi:HD-GYP domain-containing protein (c-di-GMP phosphodiesterase class II)